MIAPQLLIYCTRPDDHLPGRASEQNENRKSITTHLSLSVAHNPRRGSVMSWYDGVKTNTSMWEAIIVYWGYPLTPGFGRVMMHVSMAPNPL